MRKRAVEPGFEDTAVNNMVLKEALGGLSENHRAALMTVYMLGIKMKDAAPALGISVGTVRSRLAYGAASLRMALGGSGLDRQNRRFTPGEIK